MTLFEHFPEAQPEDKIRFRPCHFIGLDYAEYPTGMIKSLSSHPDGYPEEMLLENGMTMEIHPNVRPPGLGFGAIGDVFLVTPNGGECLTKYPRELIVVDPR